MTDPQEKRIRIGHTFIDVFRDEAKSIPNAHVRVTLHKPIDARRFGAGPLKQERDKLMSEVRAALESGLR